MKPTITEAEWFKGLVEKHPEIEELVPQDYDYAYLKHPNNVEDIVSLHEFVLDVYNNKIHKNCLRLALPDSDFMRMRIREKGWNYMRIKQFDFDKSFEIELWKDNIERQANHVGETEWQAHVLAWLFTENIILD